MEAIRPIYDTVEAVGERVFEKKNGPEMALKVKYRTVYGYVTAIIPDSAIYDLLENNGYI